MKRLQTFLYPQVNNKITEASPRVVESFISFNSNVTKVKDRCIRKKIKSHRETKSALHYVRI